MCCATQGMAPEVVLQKARDMMAEQNTDKISRRMVRELCAKLTGRSAAEVGFHPLPAAAPAHVVGGTCALSSAATGCRA